MERGYLRGSNYLRLEKNIYLLHPLPLLLLPTLAFQSVHCFVKIHWFLGISALEDR